MLLGWLLSSQRSSCLCTRSTCRFLNARVRYFSQKLENKYLEEQKQKIIKVINEEFDSLSRYDISKARLRNFLQWKNSNGKFSTLTDIEAVEGFTERTAKKLFDSILIGPVNETPNLSNKIKGQILQPLLKESVIKECNNVLTVYISVKSVCWTLIEKDTYSISEWKYYGIDYPDGKKFQITDIMDLAWRIAKKLPTADIYVMKAEATTLRAAGSDPNNPKVIAVNLQKAQMIAMIIALINGRSQDENDEETEFKHKVYFLRPSLPYRLYGTLVGNEKVSTEQTVEMLLQECEKHSLDRSHVYVPEVLKTMFRSQKDFEQDMLGQCLLLGLTFMDLCVYKNKDRVSKLLNSRS